MLSVALIAALAVIAWSYPRLATPLSYRGDQPLIDRTYALAAKKYRGTLPAVTPIVMHHGAKGTTCVDLRTRSRLREGSFLACYDASGKLIEEIAGPVF
ncbi:MAG TPA: hypothetical protein VF485_19780 [Sphingomonas sp.]